METGGQIRGSLVARNTVLNLVGHIIPLLVALVAVPYIVHGMGVERFGIFSLVFVILGYSCMFNLGLGRATTKFVAEALGKGDEDSIPGTAWTSVGLQVVLGTVGGVVLALATPLLAERVFAIPPYLVGEAKLSFYFLSISLPVVIASACFRGLLEAAQRFDLVNAVKIPFSSLLYLLPAAGIFLGFQLPGVVGLVVLSMVGAGVVYLSLAFKVFPSLRHGFCFKPDVVGPLFVFGGWVTLCGFVVPVLIYSDRLLISTLISVAALGYYTAPYEIVFRLQIVPRSLITTLFPAFSTVSAYDKRTLERLYATSIKFLMLVMGPMTLVVILFAGDILRLWLGPEFAEKGTLVFQLLAAGMLLNAVSQMPASLLDAVGRPDLRAKVFFCYVLFYLGLAWWLIGRLGIVGAAWAWALRGAFELVVFALVSWRLLKFRPAGLLANRLLRGLGACALLAVITPAVVMVAGETIWAKGAATLVCLLVFAAGVWFYALDESDIREVKALLPWAK